MQSPKPVIGIGSEVKVNGHAAKVVSIGKKGVRVRFDYPQYHNDPEVTVNFRVMEYYCLSK